MNILLAIDDSPDSRHMLAWLGTHPEWLSPAQHYAVVHVQAPLPNGLRLLLDATQVDIRRSAEAHSVFRPVRTFLEHHGIHAEYLHPEGAASDVIVEQAARMKADLIVMGSRGHGAMGQWLLGAVVSRVLATSSTPVLVVPPPGRGATAQ